MVLALLFHRSRIRLSSSALIIGANCQRRRPEMRHVMMTGNHYPHSTIFEKFSRSRVTQRSLTGATTAGDDISNKASVPGNTRTGTRQDKKTQKSTTGVAEIGQQKPPKKRRYLQVVKDLRPFPSRIRATVDGLDEEGLESHWFEEHLEGLKHFVKLYGHGSVPVGFRIPSPSHPTSFQNTSRQKYKGRYCFGSEYWPSHLHDMKLGRRTHILRYYGRELIQEPFRQQLEEAGHIWDHRLEILQYAFDAFQHYKFLHGHTRIPADFVVPTYLPSTYKNSSNTDDQNSLEPARRRRRMLVEMTTSLFQSTLARRPLEVTDQNEVTFTHAEQDSDDEEGIDFNERKDGQASRPPSSLKKYYVDPEVYLTSPSQWPEEFHGYRLGVALRRLRSQLIMDDRFYHLNPEIQKLGEELQLTVDMPTAHFELVVRILSVYRRIYGHALVPRSFKVPKDVRVWPKEAHGIPFGALLADHKHIEVLLGQSSSRKRKLEELGLSWIFVPRSTHYHIKDIDHFVEISSSQLNIAQCDEDLFRNFLAGLHEYRTRFNRLAVPSDFVVPTSEPVDAAAAKGMTGVSSSSTNYPWPNELQGIRLGEIAEFVRRSGLYVKNVPERKKILDDMGFIWAAFLDVPPGDFCDAIVVYSKYYGTYNIPPEFVVPLEELSFEKNAASMNNTCVTTLAQDGAEAQWPPRLKGYPLGSVVQSLWNNQQILLEDPHFNRYLRNIGFIHDKKMLCDRVYQALSIYATLGVQSKTVPSAFVIPASKDPDHVWPKELQGFPLGRFVSRPDVQSALREDHGRYTLYKSYLEIPLREKIIRRKKNSMQMVPDEKEHDKSEEQHV